MIVTAIDAGFFDPLVALVNSIRANSPMPIAVLTYGNEALAEDVEALGVDVWHNVAINAHLPEGEGTPAGCEPMYARLLAPAIFGDCIWLDADQIVQDSLQPLMALDYPEPCAAVPALDIQRGVVGMTVPRGTGIYSGLIHFNAKRWQQLEITERCFELMARPNVRFRFVVQSVLDVVLAGNFHRLGRRWQGFANRPELDPTQYAVLHWHGRELKPWSHDMPNAHIWREYFCMSS